MPSFVTDHNSVAGLRPHAGPPTLCPGTEVSAWKAHVVLLGDSVPVDQGRYNGSLDALRTLLRDSDSAYGALSVLSLPEYERNQWARLDTLVAAGADGFEIVNASPKANELSRARRDSVVALARRTDRFVVGASDIHGWGATSMVWNLMPASPRPGGRNRRMRRPAGRPAGGVRVLPDRRAAPAPRRQRLAGLAHAPGSAVGDLARDGLDAYARLARMDLAPVGRRPPAV